MPATGRSYRTAALLGLITAGLAASAAAYRYFQNGTTEWSLMGAALFFAALGSSALVRVRSQAAENRD